MRVLMTVAIPTEGGNKAITDGTLPRTVTAFVEKLKPEAAYFGSTDGRRAAYFVFDLKDPASLPSAAEPFFLNLNASIGVQPVMNLEEMRSGVAKALGH